MSFRGGSGAAIAVAPKAVVVGQGAAQTLVANTVTPLQFTQEDIDDLGAHDNATNNTRITPGAGTYIASGSVRVNGIASGKRIEAFWRKNGVTDIRPLSENHPGVSGVFPSVMVSATVRLDAPTDYLELMVRQTDTVNRDTEPSSTAAWLVKQ